MRIIGGARSEIDRANTALATVGTPAEAAQREYGVSPETSSISKTVNEAQLEAALHVLDKLAPDTAAQFK